MSAFSNFTPSSGRTIVSLVRSSTGSVPTSTATGSDGSVTKDARAFMRSTL